MSPRRDIETLGLPEGFTLRKTRASSHLEIVRPDGTLLRDKRGLPIKVALTPSDWRSRKNEAARIRRALA